MTRPCQNCGSTAFRADRSLGGRLICQRCGLPQGASRAMRTGNMGVGQKARGHWRWIVLIVCIAIVVVMLSSI